MTRKTRILMVEDNPTDLDLIQYELKKGGIEYSAERVQTEQEYEHALKTFAPDIILSDFALPFFNGPTAFKIRQEMCPDTPFIFVSGTIGEENSIEYIKSGVTDYVLKDKLFTISTKVKRALRESEEKQQRNRIAIERIKSEKRLVRAQQVAQIGNWETNLSDLGVIWSQEVYRIFEIEPDHFRPTHPEFLALVHPEDRAKVDEAFTNSIQNHLINNSIEHRLITASGHVKVVEERWEISYDEQGTPLLAEGTCQDITERKRLDAQLEFDRNNLLALINNTSDLMWSVDREYRLITSNYALDEMVRQMTGRAVIKGDNVLASAVNEKQLQRFKQRYDLAFSGGAFTEIEHTQSPVEYWSEISFYPIYKGEEVIGTACFSRNITEQRKAESHLRLLESVITHSNDAILITEAEPIDEPGPRIVYVNGAFTKMTGYTEGEVIGKTPRILQGPKTDRYQLDKIREALSKHEIVEVEVVNYKKNGDEFWTNFSIVPVTDKEGVFTHCVSIQRDVTARRLAEQITRMRLEGLVEARTRELNIALANEKQLVELKNNFISVASHEFRTPLSTISLAAGFVRKYQQKMKPVEIESKMASVERQVSHMTSLLDDVLMVGKATAGKAEIKFSLISIDFLEELAREVVNSTGTKHHLQISSEGTRKAFRTDQKLIRAIIINLVTNAIKFSPDQNSITVNFACTEENLLISVKDSGIGIPAEDLKNLFSAFSRGSNVAAIEGTGLGLSIVKNACDLLRGSIRVESELGRGTEFIVTLPLMYD